MDKNTSIQFTNSESLGSIKSVVEELKGANCKFEFHDIHYPSRSDPGAYICYANYDSDEGLFDMTLGNHGWSGGIYRIKEEVVVQQLLNLSRTVINFEVRLSNATFFSHYNTMSDFDNIKVNNLLLEVHGKHA